MSGFTGNLAKCAEHGPWVEDDDKLQGCCPPFTEIQARLVAYLSMYPKDSLMAMLHLAGVPVEGKPSRYWLGGLLSKVLREFSNPKMQQVWIVWGIADPLWFETPAHRPSD